MWLPMVGSGDFSRASGKSGTGRLRHFSRWPLYARHRLSAGSDLLTVSTLTGHSRFSEADIHRDPAGSQWRVPESPCRRREAVTVECRADFQLGGEHST